MLSNILKIACRITATVQRRMDEEGKTDAFASVKGGCISPGRRQQLGLAQCP
jgi:hypothetical protein